MLSEKRIEEAKKNVKTYLEDGLIKKVADTDKSIMTALKKNSEESLMVAQLLFNQKSSNLWILVSAYYSMFYIAKAALCRLGYKVGSEISHKVTADALIVFARNKLKDKFIEYFQESMNEALSLAETKADEIIQSFDYERLKRNKFQYEMVEEIKTGEAETSLKRAKDFIFEIGRMFVKQ